VACDLRRMTEFWDLAFGVVVEAPDAALRELEEVAELVAGAQILRGALDRVAICSNDPVCADHVPDNRSGDRATHGAACHGCLLIAETSCEMRNLFLDRSLLVPTMAVDGAEFFPS
jgi:hypothetical protein